MMVLVNLRQVMEEMRIAPPYIPDLLMKIELL